MGDRAQIHVEDNGVILYTHWNAREAEDRARKAIGRAEDRWGDPPYLARVLFEDLVAGDDTITGFGIDTRDLDTRIDIYVNCEGEHVTVKEWGETQAEYSFDGFVED